MIDSRDCSLSDAQRLHRATTSSATRALVLAGASLTALAVSVPAQAACSVAGSVAECSGAVDTEVMVVGSSARISSTAEVSVTNSPAPGYVAGALYALSLDGSPETDAATIESRGDVRTTGADMSGLMAGAISSRGGVTGSADVDSEGDIETLGASAHGIWAFSSGNHTTVRSVGNVRTEGANASGIIASSDGETTIDLTGNVLTEGYGAHSLVGVGQNVTITADGTISTSGDEAIGVVVGTFDTSSGDSARTGGIDGDIVLTVGTVTTEGDKSHAIDVATTAGSIEINAEAITTNGDDADGIRAELNGNGSLTIEAGSVLVTGSSQEQAIRPDGYRAEHGGIVALAEGGNGAITVNVGTVEVAGEARYGIATRGNGAITISADEVTLASADSVAVVARAGDGDVSITTGAVTTTGASGTGVYADTTTGNIVINAGTTRAEAEGQVGSFAAEAVAATSQTGAISITSADAFTAGEGASAISAFTDGDVSIASGLARTSGDFGVAIFGVSYDGDVLLEAAETATSGSGTLGIFAVAIDGNATVEAGSLTASGASSDGIVAQAGEGTASITTTGDVLVSDGLGLQSVGRDVSITTAAESVTQGATFGISAYATQSATIENSGTVISTGAVPGSAGIAAQTDSGNIVVTSHAVENAGDEAYGIIASSVSGDIAIQSNSVLATGDQPLLFESLPDGQFVTSDTSAIRAVTQNGNVDVRVNDVVATGANGRGVFATGRNVDVLLSGTIEAATGVIAQAQTGTANIIVDGAVISDASGVSMLATQGSVEVAASATISSRVYAVALTGTPQQYGFIELTNNGAIEAIEGIGIQANNFGLGTADFYIQNNGTIIGGGGVAIATDGGDDVLELTELSQITGLVDLGGGDDRLVLDFNDDASTGAVGQVVSSINVEGLSVDSGVWRADGVQSVYNFVEVEEGAVLTVAENADGELAIATPLVELDGRLNLELTSDTEAGDLQGLLLEGSGSLHLTGTATVLVDDATGLQHTGGTFVDDGALLLETVYGGDITTAGDGVFELGTNGDFTGNLVNDGTFVFARDSDYNFLGDFSGSGLLQKDGDSVLTFAGLYAFEGTTSVLGGSVKFAGQLTDDTELDLTGGTIDLSQVDGGEQTIAQLSGTGGTLELGSTQLIIQQMGNTVFSGTIAGTGDLIKNGEGDLKLNGDGTDFTGTGQVDGGTLSVNGNFSNANFLINQGGTLGGAGTIGDTNVDGGRLAPGNSIDTLTVAGDVTFTASSIYEVEVDAAGNADLLQVTGTATLGNAAVEVVAQSGTYRPLTDYTILTADEGIEGTFGSVETNLAFLDPSLSYSANAVTLRLVRNDIDFAAFASNSNQSGIAKLIESYGYGNALYNEALTLVGRDVARSFATLTGEVYPAYGAALIETAEVLRRQTATASLGDGAYAWATGLYNQVDGGRGAGTIDLTGQGAAGGFGFGANGFSASAGLGILDQDRGGSQFSDGEVTFAIGRLGYTSQSGFSIGAGVQFGWVDAQTRRQTSLGSISQAATGQIDGDYVQLFGDIGYRVPVGDGFGVEPFVGVSHVSLNLDALTESGAPTALAVSAIERDVTFADIGVRLEGNASDGLRPFASAAYRHAWGDRASLAAVGFAGLAGSAVMNALPIAKSAAELSGGVVVTRGAIDFELGYDATLSKRFNSHGVSAGFTLRF